MANVAIAAENIMKKELIDLSNEVMGEIINDVLALKRNHKELEHFSDYCITKNKHGINSINYKHVNPDGTKRGDHYAFGLTIVSLKDFNIFNNGDSDFDFGFTHLGLKFVGYQERSVDDRIAKNQFNIFKVLQKRGRKLLEVEQNALPFVVKVSSAKKVYKVNEDIEFTVTLENKANKNYRVKKLNLDTLFFLYDGEPWGASLVGKSKKRGKQEITLKPKQSISQNFIGKGSADPKVFELICIYSVTYNGVNPFSTLSLEVIK